MVLPKKNYSMINTCAACGFTQAQKEVLRKFILVMDYDGDSVVMCQRCIAQLNHRSRTLSQTELFRVIKRKRVEDTESHNTCEHPNKTTTWNGSDWCLDCHWTDDDDKETS